MRMGCGVWYVLDEVLDVPLHGPPIVITAVNKMKQLTIFNRDEGRLFRNITHAVQFP
jgi:hypothetical protein